MHASSTQLTTAACAAIRLYEQALALRPQHAEALYNMGVACFDAGACERASFFYETALAHAPACAEAWNNLGAPFPAAPRLLNCCADSCINGVSAPPDIPSLSRTPVYWVKTSGASLLQVLAKGQMVRSSVQSQAAIVPMFPSSEAWNSSTSINASVNFAIRRLYACPTWLHDRKPCSS